MKTISYLKIATAIALISFSTSCKKKKTEPNPVSIAYKITTSSKEKIKMTNLSVTSTKGKDSVITAALDVPKTVATRRAMPGKGNVVALKTKIDKPAKITLEILVNNKVVKTSKDIDVKDITKEVKLEHKF